MPEEIPVKRNLKQDFPSLAANIRSRRQELGLTLQDVADVTNLSVGFISQVERNLTSPSLSSLAALSRTLGTRTADLFEVSDSGSSTTRSGHRPAYRLEENGISYERVSTGFPGNVLNAVIANMQPGYRSEEISHEGEELFYVIRGSLTVELDGNASVLKTGDTIHFHSGCRHSAWNHTSQAATVLITCTMELFGN
ncbi:MAG: XRE family transcriptional regulator [Rhodobacteraceae bacterium]|nr:XRE family transcriptional regulator [Paracoccaceae bacterium]